MARRPLGFTLAAALVLLPQALPAEPFLVKDLNTLPALAGSIVADFRGFAPGTSYFVVNDAAHGSEVWRTDGTAGGTERVTDVCAGFCGSRPSAPSAFSVHAGRAYFVAD